MPQARLPDINTAFIVYRREAITSWKGEKYDSCFGSLQTLNGLLPDKYRVKINTKEYDKQVNLDILYTCGHCHEDFERKTLQIKEQVLTFLANVLTGQQMEQVWICPKCNKDNKLNQTNMKKRVLQEPYFIGVVPKPPERTEGMQDRTRYHNNFSRWFWACLSEIEAKMAQFRDDNWHKQGELMEFDEADFENTGEDED